MEMPEEPKFREDMTEYAVLFFLGYTFYINYGKERAYSEKLPSLDCYIKGLQNKGLDVRVHNLAFDEGCNPIPNSVAIFIRNPKNRPKKIHDGEVTNISLDTFLEYLA